MRSPGFQSTLSGEWQKFWALPSSRTVLLATVLITIGLSTVVVFFGAGANLAAAQHKGDYNTVLFASRLGIWAYVFLGANFMAMEFRTGLLDYTFVATPRRARVLTAKMIVVGGVGLITGLMITLVNAAMTQSALAVAGYPTLNFSSPNVARVILLFNPVGMLLEGVLGGLIAVLTRHAVGAFVLTILLDVLPVTVVDFFGDAYARTVPRWTTGALEESVAGLTRGNAYLPAWLALLGVAGYIMTFGTAAIVRLSRADAR